MFLRKYWLPLTVFVLIALMGCGLFYGRKAAKQEPVKVYKPVEVEKPAPPKPPPPGETAESGHWHGDVWHAEPHSAHAPGEVSQPPEVSAGEAPPTPAKSTSILPKPQLPADFVNPTSKSSNPLFADGVPEHLQCPPEFIGVYSLEDLEGLRLKLEPILEEIKEKWNPNRPIVDLWEQAIAFEIWCRDNADPEKAEILAAQGRVDWLIQMWLDFPEMTVLSEEDPERFSYMCRVAMGDWDPDFNKFTLIDGRTFRSDDDKKYVFTMSKHTETEDGFESRTVTNTFGPSNGDPNAEVVEIDLDTISDEELEALSGWNYNINPYTTGLYKLGDNR